VSLDHDPSVTLYRSGTAGPPLGGPTAFAIAQLRCLPRERLERQQSPASGGLRCPHRDGQGPLTAAFNREAHDALRRWHPACWRFGENHPSVGGSAYGAV